MRGRKEPTTKAKDVLGAIRRLIRMGSVPSLGDIAQHLKRSKNAVYESVCRLEKGGWIKRSRYRQGCKRTISLT